MNQLLFCGQNDHKILYGIQTAEDIDMKKLITLLLLAATFLGVVGCSPSKSNKFNSYIPDATSADLEGYVNLENSDGFKEITYDHVVSSVGNDEITAYLLVGSTSCHYCQNAIVEIQKQALTNNETVYYLSLEKIESEEQYNHLVEILKPILQTDNEGNPTLFMPHLFKIVNGELVDGHLGFGEGYDYSDVFACNEMEK